MALYDDVDIAVIVQYPADLVQYIGCSGVQPAGTTGEQQPVADTYEDLSSTDIDLYILIVDVIQATLQVAN